MDDQTLKHLLQKADADYPVCGADADFARRIFAIDRRRTRIRHAAGAVIAILIFGVTAATLHVHREPSPPTSDASSRDSANELAALEIDAAMHEQTADRILRDERAALRNPPHPQPPDVLAAIALERERAAMLLIDQGDWQTTRSTAAASLEYRRARELFPETFAANIARDRLEKMNSRKEG